MDFVTATPGDLLAALEQAGRTPGRVLLEACLNRQDDLIPGLLQMLEEGSEQGYNEDWVDDDPRWYRDVHAGVLLCAFREEKALPLFDIIFRDDEQENLWDWFSSPFQNYGPLGMDLLIDLLRDRNADAWARIGVSEMLKDMALLHPETRDRIVEVLRAKLPRVDQKGNFVVPPLADEDQVELWTFVACGLAELKDFDSRARGRALYKAGLIDENVMGDEDDYLRIFDEDRTHRMPRPFDLITFYHPPRVSRLAEAAQAWREEASDPEIGTVLDESGTATFVRVDQKVGRNNPCPCGSGKKYKKCCAKR